MRLGRIRDSVLAYQDEVTADATGCQALWAAVVVEAIKDMDDRVRFISHQARDWIMSNETTPQAFLWVADMIDIDGPRIQTACLTRAGRMQLLRRTHTARWGWGSNRWLEDPY